MKRIVTLLAAILLIISAMSPAIAAPFTKLEKLPLSERWYGIFMDGELVGFNRQLIAETPDGYRMEGDSSYRMKVMGVSKESSIREKYLVGKNLALRSFEVERTVNGQTSRATGKAIDSGLKFLHEAGGKSTEKIIKARGVIFPGPSLNFYPLMRDPATGKSYKLLFFDAEELKVKELKITVMGEEKTPDGQPALKLRNNLFTFVDNDIWVDREGNTIFESVREGLVTTRVEDPKAIAPYVSSVALSKKDLIYDFSLVRVDPPLKEAKLLKGLSVEIAGWNDALPLLQEGGQVVEKSGEGRIVIRTGSAVPELKQAEAPAVLPEKYLKPGEKIESEAPEIVAKAKELVKDGTTPPEEVVKLLAAWTSEWLKDTIDDGGSALESIKARTGNCQTHARLYTALARANGIPTRFVSGLVYQEGKGFLYHSWTESFFGGKWVAVDPTYNQVPADPTHLKLLEGSSPEDLSPIIAIIGRIKVSVKDAKY